MKRLIIAASLFIGSDTAFSQSVQDGNNHLYYERYQSAEKIFSRLTKADPSNAEAWFGLTKTYMLTNKDSVATAALATAPTTVQEQPLFEVAKGWNLLAGGDNDSATPLFEKALHQTNEKDPQVLSAIAQAHIDAKTGNAQYAVDLLNKAIKRNKHNAELYVQLGDAYRKTIDGSAAYQAYKQAIQEADKYAAAYHSVGQIFLTQKNEEMYLDYFRKAIAADPAYAPSLYKLYLYQFYHDPAKAMDYYKQYMAHSDASVQNEYDLTDLLYLTKDYSAAVQKAKTLMQQEGEAVQPRLYKLIAYSYADMKDTATAMTYMQQYFDKAPDSLFIAKDYILLSDLSTATGQDSLAATSLTKAVGLEKDSAALYGYYKKISDLYGEQKDFAQQAAWLGKYNENNPKATNVDLFYWGVAHYRAENFAMADSVFGKYIAKYPEQAFGYYWQAKSKARLDEGMKEGLAVPVYKTLTDVLQKDTTDVNHKKWMAEAYSYLAAYETNTNKNYEDAVGYFEKVLEVDPGNADAKKYIDLLEKNIDNKEEK